MPNESDNLSLSVSSEFRNGLNSLAEKQQSEAYQFFTKYVATNPNIDKSKPVLNTGAGDDLASFLGSGISEAVYIDTRYAYTYSPKYSRAVQGGFNSLIHRVRNVDMKARAKLEFSNERRKLYVTYSVDDPQRKSPIYVDPIPPTGDPSLYIDGFGVEHKTKRIEVEMPFVLSGEIRFLYQGGERIIMIEARDARYYRPREIDKQGYSVYVSTGHGVPELYRPTQIQADAYVVSLPFPKVFGYGKTIYDSNANLALAMEYHDSGLTQEEAEIIIGISIGKIQRLLTVLQEMGGDIHRTNEIGHQTFMIPNPDETAAIMKQKLKDIRKIRPMVARKLLEEMKVYYTEEFRRRDFRKPEILNSILKVLQSEAEVLN